MLDAHALRPPLSSSTMRALATARRGARTIGSSLYREARGRGEPVVLLHGLCGSARYFGRLVDELPDARTIAVDLLGFGRSPWPDCDYTPACHVRAVEDSVLPEVGGGRFHVVGHSTGADLALELAARHADRVKSVVLLALPYFDSAEHARASLLRHAWARLVVGTPLIARGVCETMCAAMRRLGPRVIPLARPVAGVDLPVDVCVDAFLHSFASVYGTLHRVLIDHRVDDAARRLEQAGVPVTLLHDEHDPVVPFAGSIAFRSRYANTRLRVVTGTGHLIACAEAKGVAHHVRDALRRAA
jgi:pimeloyl-ACP methyl ester carboxylesterase